MSNFDAVAEAQANWPGSVSSNDAIWNQSASLQPQFADDAISVERVSEQGLSRIVPDWTSLLERALDPNVFMDPAFILSAANDVGRRRLVTLLAWRGHGSARRLAALWSFAVSAPDHSIARIPVLKAPAYPHAYLATPVIDRNSPDNVLDALLSFIEREASLPKVIVLDPVGLDSQTTQALSRALAARGATPFIASIAQRPVLKSELDGKQYLDKSLSASSRKKLRQHRRRLEEKGKLSFKVMNEAPAVCEAFHDFMALEARGWKGRRGTALRGSPEEASFSAAMIARLAERRKVAIHGLYLDQKPISMQVVLRAGNVAFTWKTAYDEAFRDYSPGMLLLEDYTRELLSDRSIQHVDSCAYDDSGFMSAWTDRQAIGQIWISARRGPSIAFAATCRMHLACLEARRLTKQLTASWRRKWMRR